MWIALALACWLGSADSHPVDTGADTSATSAVDTAACPETSGTFDECCWDGRPVAAGAVELAAIDDAVRWDGSMDGVLVIRNESMLLSWWAALGETDRFDSSAVDFSTEVAVGWIGLTFPECHEVDFDGLRAGDAPGTWFAGVSDWTTCADTGNGCGDSPSMVIARLWKAPLGDVTPCSHGGFCDG